MQNHHHTKQPSKMKLMFGFDDESIDKSSRIQTIIKRPNSSIDPINPVKIPAWTKMSEFYLMIFLIAAISIIEAPTTLNNSQNGLHCGLFKNNKA